MSWLARSIANSLRLDDDDVAESDSRYETATTSPTLHHQHDDDAPRGSGDEDDGESDVDDDDDQLGRGGVKEDLSEFRETLTRQLWGVATFLAPPPPHQPDRDRRDSSCSGDVSDEDVPSDFVSNSRFLSECSGGRIGNGIGNGNSSNMDMDGVRSKGEEEDEDEEAVGLTEEVLAFASNIAHHPETWLDFPLSDDQDMDDFEMSDTQWYHAMAIERLAPRLAALRIELCPAHMSESFFWKVYFVLLLSRLNKHDDELLSTPQIVAARGLWMQELQKRSKPESVWSPRSPTLTKERTHSVQEDINPTSSESPSGNRSLKPSAFEPTYNSTRTDSETQNYAVLSNGNEIIDKSVIREEEVIKTKDQLPVTATSFKVPIPEYESDGDAWLQDNSDLEGDIGTTFFVANDEDVSFSDLEADDDCTMPIKSKAELKDLNTSAKKL